MTLILALPLQVPFAGWHIYCIGRGDDKALHPMRPLHHRHSRQYHSASPADIWPSGDPHQPLTSGASQPNTHTPKIHNLNFPGKNYHSQPALPYSGTLWVPKKKLWLTEPEIDTQLYLRRWTISMTQTWWTLKKREIVGWEPKGCKSPFVYTENTANCRFFNLF